LKKKTNTERQSDGQEQAVAQYARSLIEASLDPLVTISSEGKITDVNKAITKITGVEREALIGTEFSSYFTEPEKARAGYQQVFAEGSVTDYPLTIRALKGQLTDVLYNAWAYRDAHGNVLGVFAVTRDLTEQKNAAQYARSLIEASLDPLVTISPEGKITDVNEAIVRITGVSREHLIGTEFSSYFTEPDKARAGYQQVFAEGSVTDYPLTFRGLDGKLTDVLYNAWAHKDTQGNVLGVFAATRDLTGQKNAAQYARSLIEVSLDPLIMINPDGKITDVNEAAVLVAGVDREHMIGTEFSGYFTEPDKARAGYQHVFAEGSVTDYPLTIRALDGRLTDVLTNASVYKDTRGNVLGVVAAAHDITEQKRASEQMRMLATIVESSVDAIVSTDLDGIVTSWNPGAERMYGYSAEQMIGRTREFLVAPGSEDVFDKFLERIRNGEEVAPYEAERQNKEGRKIVVLVTLSPIHDESGSAIGITGIVRDITEEKEAAAQMRLLATIVESSDDAILTTNLDGIITSWNPAAERIYGRSAHEAIAQNVTILYPPGHESELPQILEKLRNGQTIKQYESIRVRRNGNIFPVSITISPMHDDNGAVIGGSSLVRDITDQKQTAEQMRILATIVTSSDDAIWSTNLEGRINSWNSAAERTFGYSAEEIIGKSISLLFPTEKAEELTFIISEIKKDEKLNGYETIRMSKDGRAIPVSLTISPIHDSDGVVAGSSIIARDITKQKELNRQLIDANDLRNEFVAMVAHDIRSPAASISGFAHLLLDQWATTTDEKKIDHLKVIARNTEHLATFIEDVLQVARIEAVEFTFNIGEFNIRELAQKALLGIAIPEAGHTFLLIAAEEMPLVLGDEDRQWQVLINLLSNAVKYSPVNEPITVRLSINEDSVEVAVIDHGIGIAKENQSKLFQKFGRVSQSGIKKVPGNGLGLYICKILVETQGGTIWCESTPGEGSTFAYTIPISRVSMHTAAPFRILILEDDLDVRSWIESTLSADPRLESSWKTTTADHALNIAREIKPALVILDDQLEGEITGLQAAPMIKSVFPDAPIIFFTSQDLSLEASKEPAIDLYLPKSALKELLTAAQQLLGLEPLASA
jgi:PAS domain S-box-containing protein